MTDDKHRPSKGSYPRPVAPSAAPSDEAIRVRIRPDIWQIIASLGSFLVAVFTLFVAILLYSQVRLLNEQMASAEAEFVDFKKERRADRIEERFLQFNSPQLVYARARAVATYPKFGLYPFTVFEFFERLARDHAEGVVAIEDVVYNFEHPAVLYWCAWEEKVKRKRRVDYKTDPETSEPWQGFQKLVEKILKRKHGRCLDQAQIEDQLAYEDGRIRLVGDYLSFANWAESQTFGVIDPFVPGEQR